MRTQDPAVFPVDGERSAAMSQPESGQPLATRRCGRCQKAFAADPGLFFQTDWALCPECEEILLPQRPDRPAPTL